MVRDHNQARPHEETGSLRKLLVDQVLVWFEGDTSYLCNNIVSIKNDWGEGEMLSIFSNLLKIQIDITLLFYPFSNLLHVEFVTLE